MKAIGSRMAEHVQLAASKAKSQASKRDEDKSLSAGAWLGMGMIAALAIYSIAMLVFEWNHSQDEVRIYLSDIIGEERFYAVNTTICVTLLASTALLFIVALRLLGPVALLNTVRLFFVSQILVFGYLAFDDRFRVHEWLGEKLETADHYYLLLVAAAEFLFLLTIGRSQIQRGKSRLWLTLAAAFFVLMIGVDALAPEDGFLRLSIEDLAKTWGCFFSFSLLGSKSRCQYVH